jgi:hypothetical protein
MSYVPKKGSLREQVCRAIHANGPMTADQCAVYINDAQKKKVPAALFQLKFYRAVTEEDGVYALSNPMRRHYGDDVPDEPEVELVVHPWKPLDMARIPSVMGMRAGSNDYRAWASRHL